METKTLQRDVYEHHLTNPLSAPPRRPDTAPEFRVPENLDEMNDKEYEAFCEKYILFHFAHYPNTAFVVPKRNRDEEG